ncbi:hypothetical protein ACFSJY_05490 [Thalassotalea euphylliae]|uniref:hypothetical protein n=1 Tax=Thalassotalea euphylliae TaxID=1655234 RepID=UPI00362DFC5B
MFKRIQVTVMMLLLLVTQVTGQELHACQQMEMMSSHTMDMDHGMGSMNHDMSAMNEMPCCQEQCKCELGTCVNPQVAGLVTKLSEQITPTEDVNLPLHNQYLPPSLLASFKPPIIS